MDKIAKQDMFNQLREVEEDMIKIKVLLIKDTNLTRILQYIETRRTFLMNSLAQLIAFEEGVLVKSKDGGFKIKK